jgi:hypothetical protein
MADRSWIHVLCIGKTKVWNLKNWQTKFASYYPVMYSYWEIAKRAQFNGLFHNTTLLYKLINISSIIEPFTFWYPHCQEWYLIKVLLLSQLHYYTAAVILWWKQCMCALLVFVIVVPRLSKLMTFKSIHVLYKVCFPTCYHIWSRKAM